jgi:EAL domain-containing protein (putative c-di-GMP-specific phosphodiesterase class I)
VTRATLARLQRGGVRVLPNDLGAGYALIGYLREIHFDGIKLDGRLSASLLQDAAAYDLLTSLINLS